MKSLEIINNEIELIHNQLNDYDEEDEEYGFYPSYDTLMYELNNYNQIKQDLEVLEIIRKQLLRSKYGVYKSKINAVVEYNKITMREIKEDEFDREEFRKLKKWLEVNENETVL